MIAFCMSLLCVAEWFKNLFSVKTSTLCSQPVICTVSVTHMTIVTVMGLIYTHRDGIRLVI